MILPYIFAVVSATIFALSPAPTTEPETEPAVPATQVSASVSTPTSVAHSFRETSAARRRTLEVWVTAYSSTPEETDDTPFLTARNTEVRDGVVAANFLPFGTRIQIPEHFGDKIFMVEDRMHRRKTNFVDIWMPTKEAAREFGINFTKIVILEQGHDFIAIK